MSRLRVGDAAALRLLVVVAASQESHDKTLQMGVLRSRQAFADQGGAELQDWAADHIGLPVLDTYL